jgi:hypothetical protein
MKNSLYFLAAALAVVVRADDDDCVNGEQTAKYKHVAGK